MTKEELIKLSRENLKKSKQDSLCKCYDEAFIKGYELSKKRIEELEEKISILLSCKKCPENKGGYICQKEYEGKCLSQKIQYIKELQEENAELKGLVNQYKASKCGSISLVNRNMIMFDQLTKAKEIIKQLLLLPYANNEEVFADVTSILDKAEQFLNSEVEK
jgi:hypothetical protein